MCGQDIQEANKPPPKDSQNDPVHVNSEVNAVISRVYPYPSKYGKACFGVGHLNILWVQWDPFIGGRFDSEVSSPIGSTGLTIRQVWLGWQQNSKVILVTNTLYTIVLLHRVGPI